MSNWRSGIGLILPESATPPGPVLGSEQGLGEDLLNSDCKFPDSRGREGLHSWASSLGSACAVLSSLAALRDQTVIIPIFRYAR